MEETKMKSINVVFEDKEYDKLIKSKGKLSWRQFILKLTEKQVS